MIDPRVLGHILLACKHGEVYVNCERHLQGVILEVTPKRVQIRPWVPYPYEGWEDPVWLNVRAVENLNEKLFNALGSLYITGRTDQKMEKE